jgi:hypothetical protein
MKPEGKHHDERRFEKGGQPRPEQRPAQPAKPTPQWPGKPAQPGTKPATTWPSQPDEDR